MVRITVHRSPDAVTLILEGPLAGPWIGEVERAWAAMAGLGNGRRQAVDLSGVTYVEEEGKTLPGAIHLVVPPPPWARYGQCRL
jgi:hypothetical protein